MKWIYCKDEMPLDWDDIVFCTKDYAFRGHYNDGRWFNTDDVEIKQVYVWAQGPPDPAPLPEVVT